MRYLWLVLILIMAFFVFWAGFYIDSIYKDIVAQDKKWVERQGWKE